jgi:hypothetical protein
MQSGLEVDDAERVTNLLLSIDCNDSTDVDDWMHDYDRDPLSEHEIDAILGASLTDLQRAAAVEAVDQHRTSGEIDWVILLLAGIIDESARRRSPAD